MAEPSLQLGNGNWAGKSDNLLAYHKANNNFYADELTFARASTGTIVNADGLIEQVPYNLLSYSNDFSQWVASNLTITADNVTSPDGTLNASKIEMTGNGSIRSANELTFNNAYTYSIFVKKGNSRYVTLRSAFFTTNAVVGFDLDTLTAQTDGTIEDYGNDWYRLSISKDISVDADKSGFFYLYLPNSLGSQTSVSGNYNYFYGGQIEDRDTAKPYYPTTTRLNVPRVDYLNNANGSLLLEPQRTNKLTTSSDFSSYLKSGTVTTTPNFGTSPSGATDSTRVVFSAGSQALYILSVHSGSDESESIYIKGTAGETIKFGKGVNVNGGVTFILNGDWQRLESFSTNGNQFTINTFTGMTARDVEIWGAQVEVGSYATSYIPTQGSSVTRVDESLLQGGFQSKNIFGSTQGSVVLEFKWDVNAYIFDLSDASTIRLRLYNDNNTTWRIRDNTGASWYYTSFSITQGQKVKIGIKWNGTEVIAFQNGFKSTNTATFSSNMAINSITSNKLNNTSAMQFYNTALTDQELITLTTI